MKISLNDVKSYNTIKDLLLYICSTIAKAQMLNKPYINYIDVTIMNNVSRTTTGLTSLQDSRTTTELFL
jgi:hypothetical protein